MSEMAHIAKTGTHTPSHATSMMQTPRQVNNFFNTASDSKSVHTANTAN
jgi:hypothetical protein